MNSSSLISSLMPTEMTSQDILFHLSVVFFFVSSLLISCAVMLHGDKYFEDDKTSGMSSYTFMVLSGIVFCSGFSLIVVGCIIG